MADVERQPSNPYPNEIISFRLPNDLAGRLRAAAADRDVTVSDLLRTAVEEVVGSTIIGWSCEHFQITGSPGAICVAPTVACGCTLRPFRSVGELPVRARALLNRMRRL